MSKSSWWLTQESFVGFCLIRPKVKPPQEKIKLLVESYWQLLILTRLPVRMVRYKIQK